MKPGEKMTGRHRTPSRQRIVPLSLINSWDARAIRRVVTRRIRLGRAGGRRGLGAAGADADDFVQVAVACRRL